jgi:hypothetical protein
VSRNVPGDSAQPVCYAQQRGRVQYNGLRLHCTRGREAAGEAASRAAAHSHSLEQHRSASIAPPVLQRPRPQARLPAATLGISLHLARASACPQALRPLLCIGPTLSCAVAPAAALLVPASDHRVGCIWPSVCRRHVQMPSLETGLAVAPISTTPSPSLHCAASLFQRPSSRQAMSRGGKLAPEVNRYVAQPCRPPRTTSADPVACSALFVKNLSFNVTPEDLFDLFGKFGPVRYVSAAMRLRPCPPSSQC